MYLQKFALLTTLNAAYAPWTRQYFTACSLSGCLHRLCAFGCLPSPVCLLLSHVLFCIIIALFIIALYSISFIWMTTLLAGIPHLPTAAHKQRCLNIVEQQQQQHQQQPAHCLQNITCLLVSSEFLVNFCESSATVSAHSYTRMFVRACVWDCVYWCACISIGFATKYLLELCENLSKH